MIEENKTFLDNHSVVIELCNKEVNKLRKEIYDMNKDLLLNSYCKEDVDKAIIYFYSVPILDTLNRSSIDILLECCDVAKQYRETAERKK